MSARLKLFNTANLLGALLILASGAFFLKPKPVDAKEWNIFIHRVQIAGADTSEDFIEIQNHETCALDLSDWKLRKRTASGTESSIKVFDEKSILPPSKTFLWANSKNAFAVSIHAHQSSTATISDDNAIGLFDNEDILIDSLSWGSVDKPFQSDESNVRNPEVHEMIVRISKTKAPNIEKTFLPTEQTSSHTAVDFCGASKDHAGDANIVLSEILANPKGDESKNEFIELENRSSKTVDLSKWTIRDASKTGKYTFPTESVIEPNAFLTLFRSSFIFALNNSHETVTLEDATGAKSDSVSWDTTHEDISLARDGARWRNTKSLTPNTKNRFGNDPTAKVRTPKKGFVGIPLSFSASTKDKDREKTKVIWNFGDGHKSYQKDPTHTFTKKKRYTVTLTYTDGVTNKTKKFRVNIENYHTPTVRIRSLVPNPAGIDTENEWILIENRSQKTVDLKGWIIATKSKRTTKDFVNHAITKSIILQPGESTKITRKESAFTLGNTRQYVELRDPRKKTAQSVHYKLEKSAPENAEFFKEPNERWKWKQSLPLDREQKEI